MADKKAGRLKKRRGGNPTAELAPRIGIPYFKPGPPKPPPVTQLTPSGYKDVKNGKIANNSYTPFDSRRIGKPFTTGRPLF